MEIMRSNKNLTILRYINVISGIAFVAPLVTLFYKHYGASVADVILIVNIGTMTMFAFELPTSILADTLGKTKSLRLRSLFTLTSALVLLFSNHVFGFIISCIFAAIAGTFASGAVEAFLQDNLEILDRKDEFGKQQGHNMFLGKVTAIIIPTVSSLIIGFNYGYNIIAGLDVLIALSMIILTWGLKEVKSVKIYNTFKEGLVDGIETSKLALKNIWSSKALKNIIYFRCGANHVSYFEIMLLILLVNAGMQEQVSGIILTIATIGGMFANKFAYLIGQKFGYSHVWTYSTIIQGLLCIFAGLLSGSWILVASIYVVFSFLDGLWQPSRNHTLVQHTSGVPIATTRSIIFAIFALYTTIGKSVLSLFSMEYALIGIGVLILLVNVILAKKIQKL